MWAVLSDIHGNLEALDAVLADIAKYSVSQIICLGDIVGYGPNPVECLERALSWDVTVLGDHDRAAMFDPEGWNSLSAERAILWTRRAMEANNRNDLWEFLAERPRSQRQGDFLFVHGSPRDPLNEDLFPEDVYCERKMTKIGSLLDRYCFCGHTHVPGVFTEHAPGESQWQYAPPEACFRFHRLDGRKAIVNVGSVGQPRDLDWRACYLLLDGWDVIWRRVEYDIDATVAKIHGNPELADLQGDRLREGR